MLGISEAVTAAIWWRIFHSAEPRWWKISLALVTAIPVLGPLMYPFLDMPPPLPPHLRADDGPPGSYGSRSSARPPHSPRMKRAGWFVGVFVVATLWVYVIASLARGYVHGYSTFYGQDVGIFLLLPICVLATVALAKRRPWRNQPGMQHRKRGHTPG